MNQEDEGEKAEKKAAQEDWVGAKYEYDDEKPLSVPTLSTTSASRPALQSGAPNVALGKNLMKQALCTSKANLWQSSPPEKSRANVRKKKNRARLMGSGRC